MTKFKKLFGFKIFFAFIVKENEIFDDGVCKNILIWWIGYYFFELIM